LHVGTNKNDFTEKLANIDTSFLERALSCLNCRIRCTKRELKGTAKREEGRAKNRRKGVLAVATLPSSFRIIESSSILSPSDSSLIPLPS
jgi:hypothetical protein